MEKIVDLIATDASPADTTDQIKDLLYTKAAAKIEDLRKSVSYTHLTLPTTPYV